MNTKKLFVFVGAALFFTFANVIYSHFSPSEPVANATLEVQFEAPQICGKDAAEKSCADVADVRGNKKGVIEEYVIPDDDLIATAEN